MTKANVQNINPEAPQAPVAKRQHGYGVTLKAVIFVDLPSIATFTDQMKAGKRAEEIAKKFTDLAAAEANVEMQDVPVSPKSRAVAESTSS